MGIGWEDGQSRGANTHPSFSRTKGFWKGRGENLFSQKRCPRISWLSDGRFRGAWVRGSAA